jgi:glycosyltransferase involved in cell wall biosynthesis
MAMKQISVVVPVLNEEDTIEMLLYSLLHQHKLPWEIILIDGGSTDNTGKIVKRITSRSKVPIKYLIKAGANRSRARNLGIIEAKSPYVALTDGGVVASKGWLLAFNEILERDQGIEVLAGTYEPLVINQWSEVFFWYLGISVDDLDELSFLPSSRSILVSKEVVAKYGGYPERLETCEDLMFAAKMKKHARMEVVKKAKVKWMVPKDLSKFFYTIAMYSKGDVIAGYQPHIKSILKVYAKWIICIFIPPCWLLYLVYPLIKFRKKIVRINQIWRVIVAQIVCDWGVITGSMSGFTSTKLFSK